MKKLSFLILFQFTSIFCLSTLLTPNVLALPLLSSCELGLSGTNLGNNMTLLDNRGTQGIQIRRDFAKSYIYANMSFPQFSSGIVGTLVAFYLTHDISLLDIKSVFKVGNEYDLLAKAMIAAHQAHGVNSENGYRDIGLGHLDNIIDVFIRRVEVAVRSSLLFLVPHRKELARKTIFELEQEVFKDEEFSQAVNKMKEYASTIYNTMTSKEAKLLSKNYRAELNLILKDLEKGRDDIIKKYSLELEQLVTSQLEKQHPELVNDAIEPQNPNSTKTKAQAIWETFSRGSF